MPTLRETYEAHRDRLLDEHGEGGTVLLFDDQILVCANYAEAFQAAVKAGAVDRFYATVLQREPVPVLLPACLAYATR